MARKKHASKQNNTTWYIAGGAVVLLIILIIIFSGGNKDATLEETPLVEQEADIVQEVLEEPEVVEEEPTVEVRIEESKPVETKKVGEEGLCEDYFFEQGDTLKILDHEIIVERIGDGALRLIVDDQNYVLNEDDSEFLGDGIRLSIGNKDILYFGADDPTNAVMIRVGCRYDDNPNEKYVQDRGESICRSLYDTCQASFDIELED